MPVQYREKGNLLGLLFTFILIIFLVNSIRSTLEIKNSHQRLDKVKNDLKLAQEKNYMLKKELAFSQTEEFLEKAALEKLNLTKPGYKILVVNEEEPENIKNVPGTGMYSSVPVWEQWLQVFNL